MTNIASESQIQRLLLAADNADRWLIYLKSIRPKYVGTPMLAKIDAAINSGENKKGTLTRTISAARDGWNWLKSEGAGAWDWLKNQTGLGFAPLAIPVGYWVAGATVAAILGAEVILNNWVTNEAVSVKKEADQFEKDFVAQTNAGIPPDVALKNAGEAAKARADAAATESDKPGFSDKLLEKGGTLVAWGIGLFVVYKIAEKKGWI